ncbi:MULTISPECIES: glycerol-3-phosphate 1-O-acyltransferase PlsY [unclassified Caulobacter]|uniref:glycerol-3-phosphate 1-O-acyltransferase PlsY n=1 Tax=unclassified Caulobacter TaxID=2648921 RepID=UPI0006F6C484|nr:MULTISPECIES: glycerol-3-phosphate 1-O-acyltransferase PlsY [unclassified Caulobacter]KQV56719.1 glycerol-3-phosphate acyltransferase [Caulobacter sp. Root342]KQV72356.1 glycerol-3-phosphate acyltransferase [Caulobacter sp. Root343]
MQDLAATAYLTLAIAVVGGYLLGSIPFGLIATRLGGAGDIRTIGSGNIGATNVLRSGRKDLAAITLIGDAGKGAVAVLLARWLTHDTAAIVALAGGAAFLGHLFPVWLKFKGGKGVATFYGVLLSACWPVGIAAGATWLAMAFLFRISSLAALTAAVLAAPFALATDQPYPMLALCLFMAVLIFIRHRENIARLLKAQEPKIGKKKSAEEAPPVADAP